RVNREPAPLDPRRLAVRVALIQGGLVAVLWLLFGYEISRQSWLVHPSQLRVMVAFFRWGLPVLALLFAGLLPSVWIHRLACEATLDVTHDTAFLVRILAFPRQMAAFGMLVGAAIFLLGAFQLRLVAGAPAIEAAKLEIAGFVTSVAFGILSYFLLQAAIGPV